jgi:hypothetical protein
MQAERGEPRRDHPLQQGGRELRREERVGAHHSSVTGGALPPVRPPSPPPGYTW